MVISILLIFPTREQRRELLGILRSVQGPTEAQPHCRNCRIYEEAGYDEGVAYVEEWESEADFHRHVRSDAYRRVLAAVEMSRMPPEIAFHRVSSTQGIELIEELRGAPKRAPEKQKG